MSAAPALAGALVWITRYFALWFVLGLIWAWVMPAHFTWFLPFIPWGLAGIMLGMGLTLEPGDFVGALRRPGDVVLGVAAQFVVMPLLGWLVAWVLNLPSAFAVGLILVACCPGGTASNVITHLAGGHLPLSVLMTTCSTLLAVLVTPLWCGFLAGAYVPVPVAAMLLDMVTVVLLPVVLGVGINQMLGARLALMKAVTPLMSVLFIILIVGAVVAAKREAIVESAGLLVLAVSCLHGLGFLLGWLVGWWKTGDAAVARTLSIEVGMQNSGLGAKLAASHFSDPLTAVPSALSAVCHSLLGSLLASIWRGK